MPRALAREEKDELPRALARGKKGPTLSRALAPSTSYGELGTDYYTADDILLKTIVRSNPGVVLWKEGTIIEKWHIRKLPEWSKVASKYEIK